MKRFVSTYAFIRSEICTSFDKSVSESFLIFDLHYFVFLYLLGGTLYLVPTLYALKVSSLLTYQLSYYYFVPIVNE